MRYFLMLAIIHQRLIANAEGLHQALFTQNAYNPTQSSCSLREKRSPAQ
jgi:hypothetical protein